MLRNFFLCHVSPCFSCTSRHFFLDMCLNYVTARALESNDQTSNQSQKPKKEKKPSEEDTLSMSRISKLACISKARLFIRLHECYGSVLSFNENTGRSLENTHNLPARFPTFTGKTQRRAISITNHVTENILDNDEEFL